MQVRSDLKSLKKEAKLLRDDTKRQYFVTTRLIQASKLIYGIRETRANCNGLLLLMRFLLENFDKDVAYADKLLNQSKKIRENPKLTEKPEENPKLIAGHSMELIKKLRNYGDIAEFSGISRFINLKIQALEEEIRLCFGSSLKKEDFNDQPVRPSESSLNEIKNFFEEIDKCIKKKTFTEEKLRNNSINLRKSLINQRNYKKKQSNIEILLENIEETFYYFEKIKSSDDSNDDQSSNKQIISETKKYIDSICSISKNNEFLIVLTDEFKNYFDDCQKLYNEILLNIKDMKKKKIEEITKKYQKKIDQNLLKGLISLFEEKNNKKIDIDTKKELEKLKKNGNNWLNDKSQIERFYEIKQQNKKTNSNEINEIQKQLESFFSNPIKNNIFNKSDIISDNESKLAELLNINHDKQFYYLEILTKIENLTKRLKEYDDFGEVLTISDEFKIHFQRFLKVF